MQISVTRVGRGVKKKGRLHTETSFFEAGHEPRFTFSHRRGYGFSTARRAFRKLLQEFFLVARDFFRWRRRYWSGVQVQYTIRAILWTNGFQRRSPRGIWTTCGLLPSAGLTGFACSCDSPLGWSEIGGVADLVHLTDTLKQLSLFVKFIMLKYELWKFLKTFSR